ncbi:hypothetical protein PFISCL1PPCAC_10415 [Pristionchus fissidentatus]|uniref:DNA/RNA-binding protein Alba-like domain-containing protein n=1 Tax=Pristionchus fissidentatus TaxID=1538716 RepID=A0AAV5VLK0_9BILA|nr:hypothetical protein PFISCL1PPCAC_10415 [Pristionchus fissidentatus]
MDNYVISDTEEDEDPLLPFPPSIIQSARVFNVNKNTKVQSMVESATNLLKEGHTCYFRGEDDASSKAITIVEIIKRNSGLILFQWNEMGLVKKIHYWNSLIEGLSRLKVAIQKPSMFILLSTTPFEAGSANIQCTLEEEEKPVKSEKREERKQNRGKNTGNNWNRKRGEARENEAKERRELVKQFESTTVQ